MLRGGGAALLCLLAALAGLRHGAAGPPAAPPLAAVPLALHGVPAPPVPPHGPPDTSCRDCHVGIEEMHPWQLLTCTECHGGNGTTSDKDKAHVQPRLGFPPDERVLPRDYELAALRFRNPSDLRVAGQTCGQCHAQELSRLEKSLHGTTAGHLSDGLYDIGLLPRKGSPFAVFDVSDDDPRGAHALHSLLGIARLSVPREAQTLADHFADLPRKACLQCHVWSEGVAQPGRLGHDGLYRGSGCASCHVVYAEDGRSRSADITARHDEPGHPLTHSMVTSPPLSTCLSCHVGDASIGNAFRGFAQLYPLMPAGPEVPGTTDRLIAEQFFLQDPVLMPPDVHFAAGMACVDCHTGRDVMGDGNIYGAMEHAIEIECSDCHGTLERYSTLTTSRGRPLRGVERRGDLFVQYGRHDGQARRIKQVRDIIDPQSLDYNPAAAAAMTPEHARMECYSCHSGWSTNFFGFHFDRNLAFTQLDLGTGQRTPGRVSTQERVFATLRHFTLGVNPEDELAPFMVGFSTMGTVRGPDGELLLDQALPRTAAGLSGMSMIHHQTHSTQPAARACVECHRNPAALGLGTGNHVTSSFALSRGLLVVAGERGVETLLLDRENPAASLYLARLALGGATRIVVDSDPVSGRAETAFVVIENAGVTLVDLRNPAFPTVRAFIAAGDARDVALAGDLAVIANGVGGVRLADISDRSNPKLISDTITREARGVAVQWPRVLVADGPGGLVVLDIAVPASPRVVGHLPLAPPGSGGGAGAGEGDARAVAAIFQPARPAGPRARSTARMLAVVANGRHGVAVADVTEPERAVTLTPLTGSSGAAGVFALDVAVTGRFDLGDTTGATPTVERDVAYVLYGNPERGFTAVLDLAVPERPVVLSRANIGPGTGLPPVAGLRIARSFNPPELITRLAVAGEGGVLLQDATRSEALANGPVIAALSGARDVAVEAFAFDRMLDETGRQHKDTSHVGARFLSRAEIHRVLSVPGEVLGSLVDGGAARRDVSEAFADAALPGGERSRGRNLRLLEDEQGQAMRDRLAGGFRIAATEDLARLVRHAWPPDFDANSDGALSRAELQRLIFHVLDANGDGELDALEWPRHPGADPAALDRNRDGRVSRQEMALGEEVFRFFDPDGDGQVRFAEWPFTVDIDPLPSFHYVDVAWLRRLVDKPGFSRGRSRLSDVLHGTPDRRGRIPDERLQFLVDRARANPGTDVAGGPAAPGFIERWDIDGDGAVDAGEYPGFARIADRCDRNGDGKIDRKDRP